ncbi:hypothetical protein D9611_006220 [Ephemerocybe angulata]|uniref:Uncharacterized protein n=1 Tax=Ephemerocybe angulata TaxID=980116 RepID=A0A8H5FGI5_9AGAR|nr:hypothetical protein D9611_006220 [Tulosesus angulatus]
MSLCGTSKGASLGRGKPTQRKVVVCGDGACGKTSLLNVFTRGFFTQVYEPTVFENYVHDLVVDDQLVELSLWDTAGQEEFDRLRSLSYAETHVVMVCFSVDNPVSLENIESKWLDEILEYCPGVKLVLVVICAAFFGSLSSKLRVQDPVFMHYPVPSYDSDVRVSLVWRRGHTTLT